MKKTTIRTALTLATILALTLTGLSAGCSKAKQETAFDKMKKSGVLRWGGDAEGGAPYVFPDPNNPRVLVGFEVDFAEALARELGVKATFVQNAWDALIPALQRGDFDVALNGLEITAEKANEILYSKPYYVYTVQLAVRKDESRIASFDDLSKGKYAVGTLNGAVSHDMLKEIKSVTVKPYLGIVEPYEDLALKRLDAVFLDTPMATYYAKPDVRLKYAGPAVGEGLYGVVIRKEDAAVKEAVDAAIDRLLASGELKKIYEKWGLWDAAQAKLTEPAQGTTPAPAAAGK